eukprot:scaffold110386_cov50-Phaeocystis_antarctica.AAC.3
MSPRPLSKARRTRVSTVADPSGCNGALCHVGCGRARSLLGLGVRALVKVRVTCVAYICFSSSIGSAPPPSGESCASVSALRASALSVCSMSSVPPPPPPPPPPMFSPSISCRARSSHSASSTGSVAGDAVSGTGVGAGAGLS